MNNTENWIIYKTVDSNSPGWKERLLLPRKSFTDILWGHSSTKIPSIGSRVKRFENLLEPGNGTTHAGTDDWVVTEVEEFISAKTGQKIYVCHCEYSPVERNWREMKRGKPVGEMLTALEFSVRIQVART